MINEIFSLEYSRAFPNKISQILKYDMVPYFNRNFGEFKPPYVINRAVGGASMDRIVRTSISDLIELRKQHNGKIIAIIGTTCITRTEVPNWCTDGETHQGDPNLWAPLLNQETTVPYIRDLINFKLAYQLEYHSLVNFYKNVVLLQDFCKLNDIVLMWVDAVNNLTLKQSLYKYTHGPNKELYTDLKNLADYAGFEPTIEMFNIAAEIKEHVHCPGLHFSEIIHEAAATKLVNLIHIALCY